MKTNNDTSGILWAQDASHPLPTDIMPQHAMRTWDDCKRTKTMIITHGVIDENTVVRPAAVGRGSAFSLPADVAKFLVEDMKLDINFLARHSPAHHLKESKAMAFKHT